MPFAFPSPNPNAAQHACSIAQPQTPRPPAWCRTPVAQLCTVRRLAKPQGRRCAGPRQARTIHRLVCRTPLVAPALRSGAPPTRATRTSALAPSLCADALPTPSHAPASSTDRPRLACGAGPQSGAEFASDRGMPSCVGERCGLARDRFGLATGWSGRVPPFQTRDLRKLLWNRANR
jgi:hypothetical protein